MIRFSTAGESHGEALIALVSGLPAGVPIDLDFVNRELWRRQQGYGRGGRMKIETDKAHVLSGVRHGKTIGSPIAIEIVNRDWKNWEEKLPVEAGDPAKHQAVASPRPGHADLAGALKHNFPDARYVLERASARESTSRVAAGAFAKLMLRCLGIEVVSHVIRVGRVELERAAAWDEIAALADRDEVVLACVDPDTEARMKEEVEEAARTGDTVNGVFEVVAHGVPAGLGTYANWDERLDGLPAWTNCPPSSIIAAHWAAISSLPSPPPPSMAAPGSVRLAPPPFGVAPCSARARPHSAARSSWSSAMVVASRGYWTTISLNSTALILLGATAMLTRLVSSSRMR